MPSRASVNPGSTPNDTKPSKPKPSKPKPSKPKLSKPKRPRGFAAMHPLRQKALASKGGQAAHRLGRAYEFTHDKAVEAGRKGGVAVSQNRSHMSAIGAKGGKATQAGNRRGTLGPPRT